MPHVTSIRNTGILRPAAAVWLAYLAAALPLVLWGADTAGGSWLLAVVHIGALGVCWHATTRRGAGQASMLLDWAPLALIPLMYAALPQLMAGAGATYHDALVQSWESALFGASPAQHMARALPTRWVSEPLHLAYFSYYALIFVPPALLYWRGRRHEFAVASFTLVATFATCFAVFVVFPVQGPRYLWDAAAVPDGPVRRLVVAVLEGGSSRGAAFPSSHVAVAVAQSLLVLRFRMPGGWVVAVLTAGLAVGAVYGGFHYAVDSIAGVVHGTAVALVAPLLYTRVCSAVAARPGAERTRPVMS